MSLSDFLADDSTGGTSWADDIVDLPSAPAAKEERGGDSFGSRGFSDRGGDRYERNDRGFGGDRGDRGFGDRGGERSDRGGRGGFNRYNDRGDRGGYEPRERQHRPPAELPTEPPFTAHIANLSFDCNEDDLADMFSNMKVSNIRLLRDRNTDRSKGFGYIEFEDVDSLKGALELNGESVQGRNIRVNIAEPPREGDRERSRPHDRTDVDTWRRSEPLELPEPRREFRENRGFRRDDSQGGFSRNNDRFGSGGRPSERPRLNLKPRTVDSTSSAPSKSSNKPDPFGGAKPVDTEKKIAQIEKKHTSPSGEEEE
ncbi:RNA-binding domain-containing protein [Backusella circina FSU 941]|nr:RNA-binding domain-containing protein [Backusella circina FSU 941]